MFMLNMYSQNEETGVLEVLKHNIFFAAQHEIFFAVQCTTLFWLMTIKVYRYYLIYKYNYTFSFFWTTRKLTNDIKTICILREISNFRPFQRFSF